MGLHAGAAQRVRLRAARGKRGAPTPLATSRYARALVLFVCNLLEMPDHVRSLRPGYLVSLLPPCEQPPRPAEIDAARHLRVEIDDVCEERDGVICPGETHVAELLAFLARRARRETVLLHCWAGISRSTAAALVGLVLESEGREREAAQRLRAAAPHAQPNRRVVALADRLLGREGRLVAALDAMGPARAVDLAPLVRLPVLRPL
jgi:predicted protein tyrosine phosphatase